MCLIFLMSINESPSPITTYFLPQESEVISVPVVFSWTLLGHIVQVESVFIASMYNANNIVPLLIIYMEFLSLSLCPCPFPDEDENECVEGNPCSHACHNAIGTYYCSCPRGLTISADGRTCQGMTSSVILFHNILLHI